MNDDELRSLLADAEPKIPRANRKELIESLTSDPPAVRLTAKRSIRPHRTSLGVLALAATLLVASGIGYSSLAPIATKTSTENGATTAEPVFNLQASLESSQALEDQLVAAMAAPLPAISSQQFAAEIRTSESLWLVASSNLEQRSAASSILLTRYPNSSAARRLARTSP